MTRCVFTLSRAFLASLALAVMPVSSGIGSTVLGVQSASADSLYSRNLKRSGTVLQRGRSAGFGPSYSYKRSNGGLSLRRAGVYHVPSNVRHYNNRYNNRYHQPYTYRRANETINFLDVDTPRSGFVYRQPTGGAAIIRLNENPCPSAHNCGYRLYEDGTGPRIITPSAPSGNGLPEFDGLASGPKVITLD